MTAAPTPYTRSRWLTVLTIGAALGWVVHALWAWTTDCEEMECLGTSLIGVGFGTVAVPLLAIVALAVTRVPAPAAVGLSACGAGIAVFTAAAMLDAAVRHLPPGDQVVPLWLAVLAGVGSAAAGLVIGGTGFTRAQRVGAALGLLMLVGLTSMPLSGR